MATSTFGKQFAVKNEKAAEFVEEMKKAVAPTLRSNFRSNSVHLAQDENKTSFRIYLYWFIIPLFP